MRLKVGDIVLAAVKIVSIGEDEKGRYVYTTSESKPDSLGMTVSYEDISENLTEGNEIIESKHNEPDGH